MINDWSEITGGRGYIARSISKGGIVGNSISAIGIFKIVQAAGKHIGKPELAPPRPKTNFCPNWIRSWHTDHSNQPDPWP